MTACKKPCSDDMLSPSALHFETPRPGLLAEDTLGGNDVPAIQQSCSKRNLGDDQGKHAGEPWSMHATPGPEKWTSGDGRTTESQWRHRESWNTTRHEEPPRHPGCRHPHWRQGWWCHRKPHADPRRLTRATS